MFKLLLLNQLYFILHTVLPDNPKINKADIKFNLPSKPSGKAKFK